MFNPYLAVIITTIIWGSTGVFIRYLNLPASTMVFFRAFVPAFILYAYFKVKKVNLFRTDLKLIFLASSIAVIEFFFYFFAYNNTSIANALVTLYTWPIFATMFGIFILKEKVSGRGVFLLISAFIGVAFVYLGKSISFSDNDFVGISSMLVSAALFGLMIIIFKKLSSNHTNFEMIFYHNFMSAIVFVPFLFVSGPFPTPAQSIVAVSYALLIGFLAYIPYYFGLKYLKASTISLLSYLEVVFGILFAIILLHETLAWNTAVGGLMIVASTLLIKK